MYARSCFSGSHRNTTMATDDVGFKVEKLTGDNYHHWKFQMKMCLIGKDVWEIVTGAETLPADASAEE